MITKKSLFVVVALFVLVPYWVYAQCDKIIQSYVYPAVTVPAGGTIYTSRNQLNEVCGYFSIMANVSGSGTVEISYQMSGNTAVWAEPSIDNPPLSGITSTSGRTGDGNVAFGPLRIPVSRHVRFRIKEIGGINSATVSITFQYQ